TTQKPLSARVQAAQWSIVLAPQSRARCTTPPLRPPSFQKISSFSWKTFLREEVVTSLEYSTRRACRRRSIASERPLFELLHSPQPAPDPAASRHHRTSPP